MPAEATKAPKAEAPVTPGDPPKKKVPKRRDRVWQSPDPTIKLTLHTLVRAKGQIAGTTVPAIDHSIRPNPAGQYILRATAAHYEEQAEAMERYAERMGLIELPAKQAGQTPDEFKPKPTTQEKVEKQEQIIASLRAQLVEKEQRIKAYEGD